MLLMQGSPFIHPQYALAGLAAMAIPLLIHLINRRRHVRVPWAAMAFLRAASRRSARRMRFEQWSLLLVRAAVIALAFVALARPFFPLTALGGLGTTRAYRIVLVDNSCSMRAVDGASQASRFDRAVKVADALLASFPQGDAVSLLTLAAPSRAVVGHPAYDRRSVRDALAGVSVTSRGTDLAGGLSAAFSLIEESDFAPGSASVYVVSDMPQRQWGGADRSGADQPAGAVASARRLAEVVGEKGLVFIRVGSPDSPNVCVSDLRLRRHETTAAGAELPMRIEATIVNHSDARALDIRMQVAVDDRIVHRFTVQPLEARATRTFLLSLSVGKPGSYAVKAYLDAPPGDALSMDDARLLSVEVSSALPVLLVEGRSSRHGRSVRGSFSGDAGYLATALDPNIGVGETSAIRVRTIPHRDLDREPLDRYRVVALCNVARLPEEAWDRLGAFVGSGGGLLVFGGDQVDAEHYNTHGFAAGKGVLPARITGVVPPSPDGEATRFAADGGTHPLLADFSDAKGSGLFLARVHGALTVEPDTRSAEVAARYTDGRPAIVTGTFGRGRVALFTTSADMSWTNLPAKGDFVSLMVSAVSYVSPSGGEHRNLLAGGTIRERLAADESSLPIAVVYPDGRSIEVGAVPTSDGFALEQGPVAELGVYTTSIGARRTVHVVNVDPDESDLRAIDEESLRAALQCDFRYADESEALGGRGSQAAVTEVGGTLLYVVLVLAVAESWMAMKFGARR